MKRALHFLTVSAALLQGVLFLAKEWWVFELFTHYILYYFVLGWIVLLLLLIKNHWKSALLLSALISIQAAQLMPYYTSETYQGESNFTVFHANFYYGNTEFDALYELIVETDPDLVLIVETGEVWEKEIKRYQSLYPYTYITEMHGALGQVMMSRFPAEFTEINLAGRPFIEAFLSIDENPLHVIGFHPPAPLNSGFATERNEDFETLGAYLENSTEYTMVLGDFNSTPWSPYFTDFLEISQLVDARLGFGLEQTWHAKLPLNIPIDHILLSPDIHTVQFDVLTEMGSDHLPILAHLDLP